MLKIQRYYWLILVLLPLAGWGQTGKDETVFWRVEEPPQFFGGEDSLARYVKHHLKYPAAAREAKITGLVHVKFIIESDGQVTHAEIVRSLGYGCDEEALRVVSGLPKWKPGRQSGKAMRVQQFLPIRFSL